MCFSPTKPRAIFSRLAIKIVKRSCYGCKAVDARHSIRRAQATTKSARDVRRSIPTPSAWREIPLASATLDGDVQGQIQILSGFAAVKRDATAAIVCVSFKNLSAMTARRVVFVFPLLDARGNSLGDLTLDRNGEFSNNVAIATYPSFASWQQGTIGPRGYADNCIQKTLPTAAVPLLQAHAASYRVARVEYDNGTVWAPPSPGP